jgi:DNA repair protein RecO (recombination protein O)
MRPSRRVLLEPAYLLHQRDWRDSSRISEFFTRDHGRIALFARGVRRAGSAYAALLQPFVPLLVSWSGSGDGGSFIGAELAAAPAPLAPACLMSGFYLNELVLTLLGREDPHPDVHDAYVQALAGLADPATEHRALRLFEKRLLDALGVGIDYAHLTDSGARVEPDTYYHVRMERGVVGTADDPAAPTAYRGADLLSLAAEELGDPASLAAARRLLRAGLEGPLDGRPLASRAVARAVKTRQAGTEER